MAVLYAPNPQSQKQQLNTSADEQIESTELSTDTVGVPDNQIALPVNVTLEQLINEAKYKLKRRQTEIELQPFWRNFSSIIALVSSGFLLAVLLITVILNFNRIPPEVPYFYDASIDTWHLADKIVIFIFPIIYAGCVWLMLDLIQAIYRYDRKLAKAGSILITIGNLMTYIALSQIVRLIL